MNKESMKMHVPGAKQAIDKMKYEKERDYGDNLGPYHTTRAKRSV